MSKQIKLVMMCCKLGCRKKAKWGITYHRVFSSGKHETYAEYACTQHVGVLLSETAENHVGILAKPKD